MAGELEVGSPRIGVFWCRAVPDGHPAMLHDTGSQIELSFMFEYGTELERMVTGRMVVWGDDPEYRNHEYELPEVAWFADARGSFCLVDPRGWRTIGGLGREGRIRFRTAVLTGHRGITYAKINAVRSRVEGLERWMAITSVHHERLRNRDDGATDLITLKRQEPVVFSRQLNATLVPSYVFKESGVPGQKLINDEIHVLTKATTARDWNDHLDLHRSIRELLVVAGWEHCGIKDIEVRRDSDPERAIAGNVLAPRWAPVTTYALDRPKGAHQDRFLFSYDDIGATGVRRWARLRGTYRRGIAGMIQSVQTPGVALETEMADIGASLEWIGYTIAAQRGDRPGQKLRDHLRRIAADIDGDVGFDLEDWCLRLAEVYNNVKHADRPDSDTLTLANTIREGQLVFRVWVARRLGIKRAALQRNLHILPMNRPYEPF